MWTRPGGRLGPRHELRAGRLSLARLQPEDAGLYLCQLVDSTGAILFQQRVRLQVQPVQTRGPEPDPAPSPSANHHQHPDSVCPDPLDGVDAEAVVGLLERAAAQLTSAPLAAGLAGRVGEVRARLAELVIPTTGAQYQSPHNPYSGQAGQGG